MKLNSRCLSLMVSSLFFCAIGCGRMSSSGLEKSSAQGAWPTGPDTVPDDPEDLDSGITTPFSNLNPDKEVWVASYGNDTAAGTLFEPKRTIGAALIVATPGTAIMVKSGVYRENLNYDLAGGTTSKPIWIRSADGKGKAEMQTLLAGSEALVIQGANALIVEGFKINGGISVGATATKSSSNIVVQNNIITNGLVDGIQVEYALNVYLIGNDVSASPRGQGIQLLGSRNILIADTYIHDLRTSGTKNDGINLKGDMREVMIQNNIIERIDGVGMVLEGYNVTARANSVSGNRRAATFSGCESCSLERNNLLQSTGVMSDVGLTVGDSPQFATADIKLISNCIYRTGWLYVEAGTDAGLVNQGNSAQACQ